MKTNLSNHRMKAILQSVLGIALLFFCLFSFSACEKENEAEDLENGPNVGENSSVVQFSFTPYTGSALSDKTIAAAVPLTFNLVNVQTAKQYAFSTTIEYMDTGMVTCTMSIPTEVDFPDGEYNVVMLKTKEGLRQAFQLSLTWKNKRFEKIGECVATYLGLLGKGTKEEPFKIGSPKDLIYLSEGVSKDLLRGADLWFKQTSRIDLNDYYNDPDRKTDNYWVPIADGFAGTYDGNGLIIKDLKIDNFKKTEGGFFQSLGNGACVMDVSFINATILATGANCIGIVAGKCGDKVNLSGLNVEGFINNNEGVTGGLIGRAEGDLTITDSSNGGLTIDGGQEVGGWVGFHTSGVLTLLGDGEGIDVNGTIKGRLDNVGGCVGRSDGTVNMDKIVVGSMHITSEQGSSVGGMVGLVKGSVHISSCILKRTASFMNSLEYTVSGQNRVGGIIGSLKPNADCTISNCEFNTTIHGSSSIGGIAGEIDTSDKLILLVDNIVGVHGGEVSGLANVGGYVGSVGSALTIETSSKRIGQQDCKIAVFATENYVGGAVGLANSNAAVTFRNLTLACSNSVSGKEYVGGYIGEAHNSTFNNCFIDPLMKVDGERYVGGLCGIATQLSFSGNKMFSIHVNDKKPSEGDYVGGLIGYLKGGTFTDLQASCQVHGASSVGGLIGYTEDKVSLDNCINNSHVLAVGDNVGGLIGNANGQLEVKGCINNGNVETRGNSIGGIIGRAASTKLMLKENINRERIKSAGNYAGGILGRLDNKQDSNFDKCANLGTVNGTSFVGGILGGTDPGADKFKQVVIQYCGNKGAITSLNEGCSGIAGFIYANFSIKESYNNGELIGSTYIGGIVGEITGYYILSDGEQIIENCYNRGNMTWKGSAKNDCCGGIIGGKGDDGGANSLDVKFCYNTGKAYYGIFGYVSNRFSYNYSEVYYDKNKSNTDYSYSAYGVTPAHIANLFLAIKDKWTANGGGGLPRLIKATEEAL